MTPATKYIFPLEFTSLLQNFVGGSQSSAPNPPVNGTSTSSGT